jgi:hypothetical protein
MTGMISGITWRGASIDDVEILRELPAALVALLTECNGFIVRAGALHVRGASLAPDWHSLRAAWRGQQCFHSLYEEIKSSDIPFAQDQVGDQYLLRGPEIYRLAAETGEVGLFCASLQDFLTGVKGDIAEFLTIGLSHELLPGELLHAYPPFCVQESKEGVSLRPCPASDVIRFHSEFARQIRRIPDGGKIEIRFRK